MKTFSTNQSVKQKLVKLICTLGIVALLGGAGAFSSAVACDDSVQSSPSSSKEQTSFSPPESAGTGGSGAGNPGFMPPRSGSGAGSPN